MKRAPVVWKRSKVVLSLLTVAMPVLGGCGEPFAVDADESVVSKTEALRCTGSPNDANCPWKVFSKLKPSTPSNDIVHEQGPAFCGNNRGAFVVSVEATTHRYRTLEINCSVNPTSWGSYGTKAFASRPSCSFREDDASGKAGFVLAGKGTDGKIYASAGIMPPPAVPQSNPTAATAFAQVGTNTYNTSQTNPSGAPAIATGGFTTSKVVMAFVGDDNRTVYAHVRALPYLAPNNTWSNRITGPTLPTGWTVVGPPSIVPLPVTFFIVVHARNGTQDRLFATHFYGDGQYFSNSTGSPVPAWQMLPSLGAMEGGPSLTYSDIGTTVWFTHSNQLLQTTDPYGYTQAVKPNAGISVASSPSASSGWGCDSQGGSYHAVVRTTSNEIAEALTLPDSLIGP